MNSLTVPLEVMLFLQGKMIDSLTRLHINPTMESFPFGLVGKGPQKSMDILSHGSKGKSGSWAVPSLRW